MVSLLALMAAVAPPKSTPAFPESTLPAALADSAGKRPIVIFVHALWCGPCNQQEVELIDTPDAERLVPDAVTIRVDADTDAGYAVVSRYGVLGYPTTLVLDATGAEIDRVEGYPGREPFIKAIGDARAGLGGLLALEKAAAENPADAGAGIALAQARLVRGDTHNALPVLEAAIAAGGPNGAVAGRILGRYYLRVKRQGTEGAALFQKLMSAYAETDPETASEFRLWAAQGLVLQGKKAEAVALMDQWIASAPGSLDALLSKASLLVRFGLPDADAASAIEAVLAVDKNSAAAHYLRADLALRGGDKEAARKSIAEALRLMPDKPTYANFLKRLDSLR